MKEKTKKFRVRLAVEVLVQACLEVLYFNQRVDKVKMVLKKNSNQDIQMTYSGRGKMRARIRKDAADIWVTGTEEEVRSWEQFFIDFASVPEFSLREYIKWARGHTKPELKP